MIKTRSLIIVMGVSGAGKSSVGIALFKKTGFPFYDGDDFHSKSNVDKMKSGKPLDDQDRLPWLQEINTFAKEQIASNSVIIACSSLKEKYRKILSNGIEMKLIYLRGSSELIQERMAQRKGHYMPTALLRSQIESLEEPRDCIIVEIDSEIDEIVDQIMNHPLFQM